MSVNEKSWVELLMDQELDKMKSGENICGHVSGN